MPKQPKKQKAGAAKAAAAKEYDLRSTPERQKAAANVEVAQKPEEFNPPKKKKRAAPKKYSF